MATSDGLPAARPNLLLLLSDQHRYDCIAAHGHTVVRTPALDRLAAEGVTFRHAFTPAPVCVPARTSLLHGCWPSRHQCLMNEGLGVPHPDTRALPSFSRQLAAAGYWLGHVGKWQVSAGHPPGAVGFHESNPGGGYGAWRKASGLPPTPHRNGWFGETDPGVAPEQSRLGWEAGQVIAMLERAASRGSPFFVRWDTSEPHLPNVVPEPFASMYDPARIAPWPGFGDTLAGKPFIQAQQQRTWRLDGRRWEDWAQTVARYLGEVSLLDDQVGRILEAVERLGLAGNTVVIYSTDHGDLCGSHGLIDKHYIMYDDVARVPLLVRWPLGLVQPGRTCDEFVIHALDLAATFCDLAGAPVPGTFQGISLLPALRGRPLASERPDVFSMYYGNQFGFYSQRMVRNRRWKYVWNATAEDELYDLEADPGELRNRTGDPTCRETVRALRRRLVDWMQTTGDQQLNEWIRDQLLNDLKP
jgi:arylsulfatase A-like enzyme